MRDRKSDIPSLVSHFLEKSSDSNGKEVKGLAPGTLQALLAHDWPGNIRELENAIERAVVLAQGNELTADALPPVLRGPRPLGSTSNTLIPGATLATIERETILRTLEMVQGSTTRAAEVLGISVRKIQYRLRGGDLVANERLSELLGLPVRELSGMSLEALPRHLVGLSGEPRELLRRLEPSSGPSATLAVTLELERPSPRVLRWVARPVPIPGGMGQLSTFTELASAEAALRPARATP